MTVASPALKSVSQQIDRLVALGVPRLAGLSEAEFRALSPGPKGMVDPVVVVSPSLVPAEILAPLLNLNNKPGFVVVDMPDLAEFVPLAEM